MKKKADLSAIDQRKDNILKVAKIVENMEIIDVNNPLVAKSNIGFHCKPKIVFDVLNKTGDCMRIPTPILASIEPGYGAVKLKWKLNNEPQEKRDKIKKLKIEWCINNEELKDEDNESYEDLELVWNCNKIVNVKNVTNDNNEVSVGGFRKGVYLFRLQCIISDYPSKVSNIKSQAVEACPAPILVSAEPGYGKVKLKWVLNDVDQKMRDKIKKLKIEWK